MPSARALVSPSARLRPAPSTPRAQRLACAPLRPACVPLRPACTPLHCITAWLAVSRPCVATQSSSLLPLLSQYHTLYCNTIWAVAQPTFALHFFFFVFHYLLFLSLFFSIISSSWKNHLKITFLFFFSFS